jgi:outer membrane PBP1 activator LpoA protein
MGTLILASPAWPQPKASDATDMQALQAAVRADKRGYVASTLALDDAESKKFWPIYDDYQRALEASNRRRSVALVNVAGQGQTIGDLHAKSVLKELVAADDAEFRARRAMREKVLKALPASKAIRYLQLEWKIRTTQDYDLASTIPLIRQ